MSEAEQKHLEFLLVPHGSNIPYLRPYTMKLRPFKLFFIYITLIFIYALGYYSIPDAVNVPDFTFIKSLYFSTVTITTLGYGDITPKSNYAMLTVASEAILGVVIIGIFLSSLWQSFADRIEKQQDELIRNKTSMQNLHKLLSFYKYLLIILTDCQLALFELTTPINSRGEQLKPNPDFAFSDMQDMYKISLLTKNGFSIPVVHLYFDKLDLLLNELKFMLSNFDLSEYPVIHSVIVDFLALSRGQDIREALYSYEKLGDGKRLMKDILVSLIIEQHEPPDPADPKNKSNVITPAIILYYTAKQQIEYINSLKEEFKKLIANPI